MQFISVLEFRAGTTARSTYDRVKIARSKTLSEQLRF
jgi:hypothetical protein